MSEAKLQEVDRPEPKPAGDYQAFWVELVIGTRAFRFAMRALHQNEAAHHALFLMCREFPTVRGFTILSEDQKTILEQVDGETFISKIINPVMQVAGMQTFKSLVPVFDAGKNGVNLEEMMKDARTRGLTGPARP